MNKIKSVIELQQQTSRVVELLPDVLMSAYRIVESFPPKSVVSFGAEDIVEITGFDYDQVDQAMSVLDDKSFLKTFGHGRNGFSYTITTYGREVARDLILQKTEEMQKIQEQGAREKIFIIHGHDEDLKKEVYTFIQQLGLTPVVLHEIEDCGRTIIEKLESEVKRAKFAVALWSPDDSTSNGTKRARQNVILETGIFCNALSRAGVRILLKGSVEIPSDLDGILRTHIDSSGKWKDELHRELRAAGIKC